MGTRDRDQVTPAGDEHRDQVPVADGGSGPRDSENRPGARGGGTPVSRGGSAGPDGRRSPRGRRDRLERLALPGAGLLTAAVLAVVFYYPVGTVLVEAVRPEGTFTVEPLLAVLQSPFYLGAAHALFTDPAGVPGGVLDWARAGFPPVRLGLFGFTAYQALLSTLLSVALGLPGAYVLARFEFPGRRTLRSLTILPFVLPAIMVAIGFVATFGQRGTVNDVLALVGLGPVNLVFTLEIIVLAHAFYNAPLVTRLVTAAWEGVDARAVETARSLGASPLGSFRDVIAPQLLPALLTASLLTFVFTFMSFPIVLALGGLRLATVEVWLYARVQQFQLTEAAALAVLETAISLALTYLYLQYEARRTGVGGATNPLARKSLAAVDGVRSGLVRAGILAYGLVVVVTFVGPLASMVLAGLGLPGDLTLAHWSFLAEHQAISYRTRPLIAVRNSLVFGVATLLVAVPMGVSIAVFTTRDAVGRKAADALLMAPLAVSGVVVGFGLLQGLVFGIEVFGHRLTATGPVAIVAAHAVAAYPFVTRNVAPMLADVDSRMVETARSLGASRLRALLDVELPLVVPGLVAGAAFAFAISVGEFDSTIILSEGSTYTMPIALERYMSDRAVGPDLGPAAAMGTVLLAVTAVSFLVIDRVGGRWEP